MKTNRTEHELYHAALDAALLDGSAVRERIGRRIRAEEAGATPRTYRCPRRAALLLAAALLLTASAALAAGLLLRGRGSRIPFFSRGVTAKEQAQADWQERNSDEVLSALSGEKDALVVENIAFHEDELTVFFSFAKEPAPSLWIAVNGGERIREGRPGSVVRTKDGRSAASMTFHIFPRIPDECELAVGADAPYDAAGPETFRVDLTGRRADARTTISGSVIWLAGTEGEPQSAPDGTEYYGPWYDHTVTVQSVTVDRDGGRIVLAEEMPGEGPYLNEAYAAWIEAAEAAKEDFFREHPDLTEIDWAQPAEEWREANPCPLTPEEISGLWEAYDESHPVSFDPFVNFAVLDENGASLRPWIPFLTGGARKGTAENTLFFTPTDDLASVTIVPLYYTGREATLTLSRDSRDPVRAENGDLSAALLGWTADTERDTVTVSFRIDGVRLLDSWSFRLTGADGTEPDIGLLYEEVPFTDPATGIVTTEVRVTGANWDPASLTGCRITLYVPYMDEARAVTVPLP